MSGEAIKIFLWYFS